MGLSTIIMLLSYIAVPKWGEPMIIFAETLFWLNAVIAVVLCFGILALMYFILLSSAKI